jgi:hypothetical protein
VWCVYLPSHTACRSAASQRKRSGKMHSHCATRSRRHSFEIPMCIISGTARHCCRTSLAFSDAEPLALRPVLPFLRVLPRSLAANHLLAAKPRFALARLATPLQCILCYAMLCYAMQCYAMLCNAMQCKNANPNAWCSGSARLGLFRSLLSQVPLADGATLDSITREARVDVPRALQVRYRT